MKYRRNKNDWKCHDEHFWWEFSSNIMKIWKVNNSNEWFESMNMLNEFGGWLMRFKPCLAAVGVGASLRFWLPPHLNNDIDGRRSIIGCGTSISHGDSDIEAPIGPQRGSEKMQLVGVVDLVIVFHSDKENQHIFAQEKNETSIYIFAQHKIHSSGSFF